MRGFETLLIVLFRLMGPTASAEEVNVFVMQHSPNPTFYSPSDISKRESELGLTSKRGSTTAFQAYNTVNIQKHANYWALPYPLGRFGMLRAVFIDFDECGESAL